MRPIYQRNHPSFEDSDSSEKPRYVCRWHRMPQAILATGSVAKASAPWYRAVTDCRPINVYAFAWRVKYITVADICLMLRPCSLMTVRDLRAAYHLVQFGGCTGLAQIVARWVTNHDGTGYRRSRFMRAGCSPGDCTGLCDKSRLAICVEGHVGRFACTPFGHKDPNTGLAILTDAVVEWALRWLEINPGGPGDAEDCEVQIRTHSHIDTLVTTAQHNTAHCVPWRDARPLVKNSGMPIPDDTPHGDVASELLVAVWAAEAPRAASTVRAIDDRTQQHVLAALKMESSWSIPLLDAYVDSVIKFGQGLGVLRGPRPRSELLTSLDSSVWGIGFSVAGAGADKSTAGRKGPAGGRVLAQRVSSYGGPAH